RGNDGGKMPDGLYSGLTKIRTRRRAADGTNGTEPIRPVLGRLREPFPLSRGGATTYRFLFIRHIVLKHRPEPDIIRLSTSVKIVLFSQLTLNFGVEK
ncbi:TPA: hypothetical protein ACJYJL_001926, partial [Neisseria gonorrhoeae]